LTVSIYNVNHPLPELFGSSREEDRSPRQTLFLATCVLYEGELSHAMAQRVRETYQKGMWIILGDDDAGNREEGRQTFMDQLGADLQPIQWTHGLVRCPSLGWREKHFSYLELNAPSQNEEN
jgi:hypothetical protein